MNHDFMCSVLWQYKMTICYSLFVYKQISLKLASFSWAIILCRYDLLSLPPLGVILQEWVGLSANQNDTRKGATYCLLQLPFSANIFIYAVDTYTKLL